MTAARHLSPAQRSGLAARLRQGRAGPGPAGPRGPELLELAAGPGAEPLFLIHAIGGTVYPYARLAGALAAGGPVYGIQAAGLRPGSAPATDLGQVVAAYCDLIRARQRAGPYRLAGWSMGGLLAFEIARKLGDATASLTLIDTPSRPAPLVDGQLNGRFLADAARTLGLDPGEAVRAGAGGDPAGWLAARLAPGAEGSDTVRGEIERRLAVFRANSAMIAGYRPAGTARAPALVVVAGESPDVAPEWAQAIDGPVDVVRIPGTHYTVVRPPGVWTLAQAVLRHAWAPGGRPAARCGQETR